MKTVRSCLHLLELGSSSFCPLVRLASNRRRTCQMANRRRDHHTSGLVMYRASILLMIIINIANASSSAESIRPPGWSDAQPERGIQLRASKDSYINGASNSIRSNQARRRQNEIQPSSKKDDPSRIAQASSSELPQRVRIAPFDLLLAPTPIQLKRADEDLLLVDLQELIILFMKTQFGHEGSITSRTGADTTLQYVLFSDIEENSWSEGGKNKQDPPRTVLRFNGGVASFVGPDIPSEEEVNEWVESSINGLFVAALAETPYNYIELTQYMIIQDPNSMVHSGDIVVAVPSDSVASTADPRPAQQNAVSPPTERSPPESEDEFPLVYVLVSLLIAIAIVAVVLTLWIRHNNHAVRVLCLSGKEREEVVDFSDDAPISISHESGKSRRSGHEDDDIDDEDTAHELRKDSLIALDNPTASLHHQTSQATKVTTDEASLHSSTSEFTIPTVSALSFRTPNPFGKGLLQESFQKERKTYISKDMLYSSWSGKAPSLDHGYGKRYDDSVLQPSYFSAAKEWERLANIEESVRAENQEREKSSIESEELGSEPQGFRFEAAHEDAEAEDVPDGLYMVASSQSRRNTGIPERQKSSSLV